MNPEWFYSDGDIRKGPVSLDELGRLFESGQLKPADLVWKEGMTDWLEARQVPELASFFRSPANETRERDDDRDRDRDRDDRRRERRSRYDDDDDRPRARSRDRERERDRYDDDEYSDYDDRPRSRSGNKPSQINTIGVLLLVGGILGLLFTASIVLGSAFICCVWPGTYFELIWSIFAIIRGTNMLNQDDQAPPKTLLVLQIVTIINIDIINCVLGIVAMVMLGDAQVQAYYRRKGWY